MKKPGSQEVPRPGPDALLKSARREARGCLRIFLGAAPGVGKTYGMLRTAQERCAQGEEIVIGVIESHERVETEQLCEGIERLALAERMYRGRSFHEFDLDAALARAPDIILVDELAHRNIPGSRHSRRYQDIEDLLDAGIDVWTTLNVQHIESLNDIVARVTGIRMRETIPDSLIRRARDITLIDLTPDELIQRLQQGKVDVPEQAREALDSFFSEANLTALRELAMQTMAERVDADVRDSMGVRGVEGPWPVRPKVLVALSGRPEDTSLIRAAHRMAERQHASWRAVHVDTGLDTPAIHLELERSSQLIERLGGEVVILAGQSRLMELLDYARRNNITTLVIGRAVPRPWRFWHRSLGRKLLKVARDFDLVIVSESGRGKQSKPFTWFERSWLSLSRREYWVPLAVLPATLAIALGIDRVMELANVSLVFLTGVLVVAAFSGTRAAMLCAVLSFLAYNFLFTEPRYTLFVDHRHQLLSVVFFLAVAMIGGQLAGHARRQLIALRESRDQTQKLLQFSRALSVAADHSGVRQVGVATLADWLQVPTVYLESTAEDDELHLSESRPGVLNLDATARQAAMWTYYHQRPSGYGSDTLSSQRWRFIPLVDKDVVLGVVGLALADRQVPLAYEQEMLIDTLLNQLTTALARTRMVSDLSAARMAEENERLRSALLSSVSHDLRTPLASIIGAASSLRDLDEQLSTEDKRELLDGVLGESERLNRYIQNLLDMTRLGHGAMKIERDWVTLPDLVNSALKRLGAPLAKLHVTRHWAVDLPLLYVHPALIEQALVNIIENAARYSKPSDDISKPGDDIRIVAEQKGRDMVICICDQGPGIPEEMRERVFDMFFSGGEGDRGRHGSGLGLAICRGMIGAHGGSIRAEDNPGGIGTCIIIHLPLEDSPPGPQESEAADEC
uniref:sensor histidine kinase n=1 Tax=Halomonas sp. TaxID=1486246 RepID=UPI002621FF8C|nr:sensor histidine kinase KdpD [Halomonas sp.]